jgi:2-polyprenyl-3-methyl-5-hydroxy-6-metoxy-1,4-benzoquinol methylase
MESSGGHDDNPFIAEFYDSVVPYRERQDVNFFVEMAQRCGGPVLEIGCGSGRVLIPTAKSGIEIVGLDASPMMLSVCREKLLSEPNDVTYDPRNDTKQHEIPFSVVSCDFVVRSLDLDQTSGGRGGS